MQLFFTDNSDMMLSGDNEMLTDDRRSTKIFNERYINIVARTVQSVTMKILIREEYYITLSKSTKIILT